MINEVIPQGTWVKFTSDAKLRMMTPDGKRGQASMAEGALIGEKLRALVVQKIANDAYTVLFPEEGHFGWVYNFEMYVEDPLAPTVKLNVVPQKK